MSSPQPRPDGLSWPAAAAPAVLAALAALPPARRPEFVLREVLAWPERDIAELLGPQTPARSP